MRVPVEWLSQDVEVPAGTTGENARACLLYTSDAADE